MNILIDKQKNLKISSSSLIFQELTDEQLNLDFLDWIFTSLNLNDSSHIKKLENAFQDQIALQNLFIYKLLENKSNIQSKSLSKIFQDSQQEINTLIKITSVPTKQNKGKGKEKNKPQQKPKIEQKVEKKQNKTKKQEISQEYIDQVMSQKIPLSTKNQNHNIEQNQRNILITSALPYVNNEPHLGNLIGAVLSADVYSRYCKLKNYNSMYICGTDEYGTATEIKALLSKKTPQQICDEYNKIHKQIYDYFDIDFDYFGRTSTQKHTEIVQEIFKQCRKNDYMLPQTQEQIFCNNCDRFLADRYVFGTCPFCKSENATGDQCDACQKSYEGMQLLEPKCFICKGLVQSKESSHLYLNLEKLQPKIQEFCDKSSKNNWTNNSLSITKSWLNEGLKPRCITRDLKWGVNVPEKEYSTKCFYVWFDAPIGYVSITANHTSNWKNWWMNPENVELIQFMGKDNVPFHTVLFPGAQLATQEKWTQLKHISTTEYLNYEEIKFSKRNGTGVFGGDVIKISEIPIEQWRFYLLSIRPENSDSQFIWTDFQSVVNNVMSNNIGNLIQRVLSFIWKNCDKKVPQCNLKLMEDIDTKLVNEIIEKYLNYQILFEKQKLREALKTSVKIGQSLNQYLQDTSLWKEKGEKQNLRLFIVVNMIRVLSATLEPFTPSLSAKINFLLNIKREKQDEKYFSFLDQNKNIDGFLKLISSGHEINQPIPLVQKIEDVLKYRENFGYKKDQLISQNTRQFFQFKKLLIMKIKAHTINLIIAIIIFILLIVFNFLLVKFRDFELDAIENMRKNMNSWKRFFEIISQYLYFYNFPLVIVYWVFSGNKKLALIFFTIISMETSLKKILTSTYGEPRPIFYREFDKCLCIYGHPSGHMSGFLLFFYFLAYIFVLRKKILFCFKIIVILLLVLLTILMIMSRYYEGYHFINQILLGIFQGYLFFALGVYLDRSNVMNRLLNFHKFKLTVQKRSQIEVDQETVQFSESTQQQQIHILDSVDWTDSKNQKYKLFYIILIFTYYLLIFSLGFLVRNITINKLEQSPADFFKLNSCGQQCLNNIKKKKYVAQHGWPQTVGFQFCLLYYIFLLVNKKPAYCINKKYFIQNFTILRNYIRIPLYLIALIPLIIYYILMIYYDEKMFLYFVGFPLTYLSSYLYIIIFSTLVQRLKCDILGDFFCLPEQRNYEIIRIKNNDYFQQILIQKIPKLLKLNITITSIQQNWIRKNY